MFKVQSFLKNILWGTSLFIVFFILYLNLTKTTTVYATLYPITKNTHFLSLVFAILLIFLGHYAIKKINQVSNIKILWFVFIAFNILGLMTKLYMVFSVENAPIADSYQVIDVANRWLAGDPSIFWPGSYLSTFQFQSSLVILYSIWAKFFGYQSSAYYFLQALLLQTSILLIGLAWAKKYSIKTALITTLLLTFFLPNTWMTQFVYGDNLAFFAISLILFFTVYLKNKVVKVSLVILSILLMTQTRTISGILVIAYAFSLLLTQPLKLKTLGMVIGLLSLLILPSQIINTLFDHQTDFIKDAHALPANTFLRIGLSRSQTSQVPGFYDLNILYDFEALYYDTGLMQSYNSEIISNQLRKLSNFDEAYSFWLDKYTAVFTDPDFESLANYFPTRYDGIDLEDFKKNPEPLGAGAVDVNAKTSLSTWILNQYSRILILEKAYLLALLIALIFALLRDRKNALLSLIIIGIFLYFGLFEIKSRYVWLFMNVLIAYLPSVFLAKEITHE